MKRCSRVIPLTFVMLGCGEGSDSVLTDPQEGFENAPIENATVENTANLPEAQYEEQEFFELFLSFKTEDQVTKRLGKPVAVSQYEQISYWLYSIPVATDLGGIRYPKLHLEDGSPRTVEYLTLDELSEETARATMAKSAAEKPAGSRYAIAEFDSLLKFKTPQEVVGILGEPTSKRTNEGKDVWVYHRVVEDNGTVQDRSLEFGYGRVQYIWEEAR